jgi:N-acetyl-anhydromuramyl-L-alanine amidase AmpD
MAVRIDRSLRLPESQYFPGAQRKTGIAIHHTVGGTAESTFRWWRAKQSHVGTAYIVERDGTVFEVFDPAGWSYQFGLDWDPIARIRFEKRFIGIELASEGGLTEHDGELYCYDRVSPRQLKPKTEAFDYGEPYSLRLVIAALQDSVTNLVPANAHAYELGYQAAYAGYRDLNDRYVAELKKPRLKLPSAIGLLGAAGVGLVVGRAIP